MTRLRALIRSERARGAGPTSASALVERSIISFGDRRSRSVRIGIAVVATVLLLFLVLVAVGPLAYLFKAATSTSSETLSDPLALWPSGMHWDNFAEAFSRVRFGMYLANTGWVCAGNWFFGMLVATTGGYLLAILRPAYGKVMSALIMATLFIPGVVTLVALYLTIMDVPFIGVNLLNTYWAVWLPAGANAFNVLLVQRSFAALPQEIFDAARVDGAGKFRVFISLVLPMSRPILGVISLLTLVGAYKEYLWPLLVLNKSDMRPLSVALPNLQEATDLSVYFAALFMALAIPLALFIAFRKQFLSAASSQGSVKG
jgi:multiple sugar transport system permease protein